MFTLRCTKKLLARLDCLPDAAPSPPTTGLGNWYANFIPSRVGDVVLFANERSLLPVVLPLIPVEPLVHSLRQATSTMLMTLGVPADVVVREVGEMGEFAIAKTANRQVLGSMNDFAYIFENWFEGSLLDMSLKLADSPCSPIKRRRPRDVALELLAAEE